MKFGGLLLLLTLTFGAARCASADVAIITNRMPRKVAIRVLDRSDQRLSIETVSLEPGDSTPVRFTKPVKFRATSGGVDHEFTFDTEAVFVLSLNDEGKTSLYQAAFDDNVKSKLSISYDAPASAEPTGWNVVKVKLVVDDEERATAAAWKKRLARRVASASAILQKYCWTKLEIVEFGEWESNDEVDQFQEVFKGFKHSVERGKSQLVLGFASQPVNDAGVKHFGGALGPLETHILLREWPQRASEAEHLELLLHELGHYLGAAHSEQPDSLMRPVIADGRATSARFRLSYDSANLFAMCLVSEDMRCNGSRRLEDISPAILKRLESVYATLAAALPDDPAARHCAQLARKARILNSRAPVDLVTVTDVKDVLDTLDAAILTFAETPDSDGDEAFNDCVRAAAETALRIENENARADAFLEALVARFSMRQIQGRPLPDADLKRITLRGRHDWLKHFVSSALLSKKFGGRVAESSGIFKEINDSRGGSGFSFQDYSANLAGIAFGQTLREDPAFLQRVADTFAGEHFAPTCDDLSESLTYAQFKEQYGAASDPRFQAVRAKIIDRLRLLPAYKKSPAAGATSDS